MFVIGFLLAGAVAGLLAGLFGVGGGIIIVPALIFVFHLQGVSPEVLTHMAVGTSLATIIPTSLSSIYSHNQKGGIDWKTFRYLVPGICLGAILGVATAVHISGSLLQTLIGLFALLVAWRIYRGARQQSKRSLPGPARLGVYGGGIGYVSAVFGIGGGTVTVPLLTRYGMAMKRAVGTSSACGLPIAVVGALFNMLLGYANPQLPVYSTGFVYWPAFVGIVLASVPCARLGAVIAHRLPADKLRYLFALLLLVIGLKFIIGS
ncbi:sulfite exporter TauE/SafE family protein [Kistimonas asteriae]|uniref:sulfite exporter TauE/SafE family protein n=1 Tax=Kistimonas asteriae TaxID=517724 RepID=UPI001BA9A8F6|nr:sulfite exporter TauE/SafE family protein [Kistimonas asteriae]